MKKNLMRIHQRGMSLVEILVAVAIGLIGILIITQAYITSDNFNRTTLGEGGAQTNGTMRCLRIQVSTGGQARMCDPKVVAPVLPDVDPRAC